MLDPIRLFPEFHERVWGVMDLSPWFPDWKPERPVGEAWLTAGSIQTSQGPLSELIAQYNEELLGAPCSFCPLLLKFLYTSQKLSVQVHPGDEYARAHHNCLGKTEAWYVVEASPGAAVALGFCRALEPEEARQRLLDGTIEDVLNWVPAKAGDVFLVPAGTVHAIGAGLKIVEVQEHSDITYRLYDYGRPRELHLEHGLAVSTFEPYHIVNTPRALTAERTLLSESDYFSMELWQFQGEVTCYLPTPYFHLLVPIRGRARMEGCEVLAGEAWLIPAPIDELRLESEDASVLVTYPSTDWFACAA
jgi:mannose-6-phosphate isomerase